MADISKRVGKRIKEERVRKGLSQEELAFKAGLHRTYISHVERGTRNITVESLEKIAKALGAKTQSLID